MQALRSSEVLALWEAGQGRGNVARGVLLLAAARPDLDADGRLDLPIGARDAALRALRRATFGNTLTLVAACPACRERLELDCCLAAIDAVVSADAAAGDAVVETDGVRARVRVPTSRDLYALGGACDLDEARARLFARCVLELEQDGAPIDPRDLGDAVSAQIASAVHEADPSADVRLALRCPACVSTWSAGLDIVACLWSELAVAAQRTLLEVDALARRYGWSEAEILSLSAARRRTYLELCEA